MRISEGHLRRLIRESIIKETRFSKQQFYNKVRSKHPGVDDLFFVHWVHGDKSENEIGDEKKSTDNKKVGYLKQFTDLQAMQGFFLGEIFSSRHGHGVVLRHHPSILHAVSIRTLSTKVLMI